MKQKFLHSLGPLVGLLLFVIALWVLYHELQEYRYHDVVLRLKELPAQRIFLSLALTILNYFALTGYDTLAFRYLRHPLPYSKIALASFLAYAFSHNLGFSLLSGGSVRYRLYSAWGLSAVEITTVVAFDILTFWMGMLTLGSIVFLHSSLAIPTALRLPVTSVRPLGVIFLIVVGSYLFLSAVRQKPILIKEWELPLPSVRFALAQATLSSLEWALAGSVLYALLPSTAALSYAGFLGIFLLAQIAGIMSQVPGGLGIFETVMLILLSPLFPAPLILGVLVAYRGIYYLLPLGVAIVLLGVHELFQRKEGIKRLARTLGRWVPVLTPQLLALSIFLGGAILLFSGATPPDHSRLAWLNDFLPLPVIELSHFLGSVVGVGLLLLARGLQQRLDVAYHLTILLLSAGIAFSLLKGFDYEEAIILAIMLGALLPCRSHFYRQTSLVNERFSPGWVIAIALVLLGSIWLGIFSHKHVEYAHELWWQFALSGDAPRFLRASVGALSGALFFATARLLRPAPADPAAPTQIDLDRARTIIAQSRHTAANLVFLGDKTLLFSDNGKAFIMYGVEGRSWIALGDPIGTESEWPELVWQFRELCDRDDGWPVFYEVGQTNLPLYLDLGLTLLKIGEEARVRLDTFSLKGETHRTFRYTVNRVEKAGCSFAIIPAAEIPPFLPQLRVVSDAWLTEKNTREKGFSLGFFSDSYLAQFPVAVVRQEETIVAFANLWLGAEKEELSPDLMRYLPTAPSGTMEYLFIQLMLWGQHEGYQWFSLGMAPFSGLENRALAPLWNRLGAFVFRHGEHFYNFQGLRQYKEKFAPEWKPKYLASPGGLALPRILTNLASLISGGLKGVLSK